MIRAVAETARTPLIHAIEQWSGYCQRYSPRTQDGYQRALRYFVQYIQVQTIGDIQPSDVQTFANSLLGKHSHCGANTYMNAVKSFCHWFSDTYNLPNPADKVRKFSDDTREARCLTPEQYAKILQVITGRDYHLIRFLANTGLRSSELEAVKPCDIQGHWLVVKGKGNKIRHVPLNQVAAESLNHILNFSRSRAVLFDHCQRIAKRADVPPFGPHAVRHFFVTRLLAKKPIHLVSKLIGHSSVTITEKIYWHFRHTDLAGLTDCLE